MTWLSNLFNKEKKQENKSRMIIRVDIDNTICKVPGNDYQNAIPLHNRILRINNLHKSGHKIIYWSARNAKTDKNLRPLTLKQLDDWGCLYDELDMNRPIYDLFIDDESLNANEYFYDN